MNKPYYNEEIDELEELYAAPAYPADYEPEEDEYESLEAYGIEYGHYN